MIEFGAAAPQEDRYAAIRPGGPLIWDEASSLTLNIWTPARANERLPVLVNIHGGGFTVGSGTLETTGLSPELCREYGFVLVSINYRLGALGFLQLEWVAGNEYRGSGSLGIADQILALKWVQENIAGFGGDPRRVTISGQSAGGVSVGYLTGAPAAGGLFHQAVDEYGPISNGNSADFGQQIARRFFEKLQLPPERWGELIDMPVQRILKAQGAIGEMLGILYGQKLWVPITDGSRLPVHPLDALRAQAGKIRLIAGCDYDHMAAVGKVLSQALPPSQEDTVHQLLTEQLGSRTDEILAYFRAKMPGADLTRLLVAIQGELFRGGLIHMAEAASGSGRSSWVYLTEPLHEGTASPSAAINSMNMPRDRLARFIVSGTPDVRGKIAWPTYGSARETLVVGVTERIAKDPYGDDRAVLTAIHFGA